MLVSRTLLPLLALTLLTAGAAAHVQVTSPNGGENLLGQQTFQVEWFDLVNHGSGVTYLVEFSADGGTTWTQVADNLGYSGGTSSYSWVVPDQTTSMGTIRVTMHVSTNVYYEDVSDGNFSITASYLSYGAGTAVGGVEPMLEMHNLPQAGGSVTVHLSQAEVGSDAHIIVGTQPTNNPFAGVTILNSANALHLVVTVDANGEVILPLSVPSGAAGVTAYIQVVVASSPSTSATAGLGFTILP